MVDIGKSASKIAQRQSTRLQSRAKSRSKSVARLKVRQVGQGVKKDAKEKVAAKKAERSEISGDSETETELIEIEMGDIETSDIAASLNEPQNYPTSSIPLGFKPPRGLRLINDPDEIPEPFDWSKVPWKKILIGLGALIGVTLLVLSARWAVPKVVDLVRDADVTIPTLPTTPTVPITEAPTVVLTTWGEGACVTTAADGTARPTTCNEADFEVTSSIAYPDIELIPAEVRALQELMTSLGVTVIIDGILGPQTRLAIDSFAVSAGLDPDSNDRAKAGAVRAASLTGGLAADGPRLVQNSPDFCGAGMIWVEDTTQIHCLSPL